MIEFKVKGGYGCIQICNYVEELKKLKNGNEVLIAYIGKENTLSVEFSYPFHNPKAITVKLKSDFTKKDLVNLVGSTYHEMYKEEEESMPETTAQLEESRENSMLLNRPNSSGKYGVWGHDITDLVLEGAEVKSTGDSSYQIDIFIGS